MKKSFCAIAPVCLAASPVLAGGYVAPIPDAPPAAVAPQPAPEGFSWTGPYAGAHAARDKWKLNREATITTPEVTRPIYEDRKVWRQTPKDEQFGGCNHGNDTCPVPVPGTGEWTPNGWTGEWLHEQVEVGREVVTPSTTQTIAEAFTQDATSYGVFAGYRHQFSNGAVMGAEATFTKGDDLNTVSIEAQAGYAAGRFLPYVALGVARTDGDTGLLAAIGVDYAVTDRFIVGAKLTRTRYDDLRGWEAEANTVAVRVGIRF